MDLLSSCCSNWYCFCTLSPLLSVTSSSPLFITGYLLRYLCEERCISRDGVLLVSRDYIWPFDGNNCIWRRTKLGCRTRTKLPLVILLIAHAFENHSRLIDNLAFVGKCGQLSTNLSVIQKLSRWYLCGRTRCGSMRQQELWELLFPRSSFEICRSNSLAEWLHKSLNFSITLRPKEVDWCSMLNPHYMAMFLLNSWPWKGGPLSETIFEGTPCQNCIEFWDYTFSRDRRHHFYFRKSRVAIEDHQDILSGW